MSVCNDSTAAFKRLLGFFLPKSLLGYGEYGVDDDASDGGLSKALLERGDDKTSNTIIGEFAEDAAFATLAKREMEQILARDAEDGEKLAAGIAMAVQRGVLPANPPVEPVTKIDVAGKSADVVANEIIAALGDAPKKGCVLVLQGLSGTGKGTTVAKLEQKLARAVCWSNGNVFRSLTLLAVSYCGAQGVEFAPKVFTKKVLGKLMDCLKFDKWDGKWDILIDGFGHELLVSKVANTTLKEPRVAKNIPSIAKLTQGEVVQFAGAAAAKMGADGMNVLMEGRSQTLDYVRTPHRFELTLSQPLVIGQRRAAQRMMGGALPKLGGGAATQARVREVLKSELDAMVAAA